MCHISLIVKNHETILPSGTPYATPRETAFRPAGMPAGRNPCALCARIAYFSSNRTDTVTESMLVPVEIEAGPIPDPPAPASG